MVKLNIGSGRRVLPGYIPIDRVFGTEAFPLPFKNASVDEIYASHIFEHMSYRQGQAAIMDWARVLKPGGICRIAVPDIHKCLKLIEDKDPRGYATVAGGHNDENDVHHSAYDERLLADTLRFGGLIDIQRWEAFTDDCSSLDVSLNLMGRRPKMIAIQSMPRLAFTVNMAQLSMLTNTFGCDVSYETGANWGQCLERRMTKAVEDGHDIIMTTDYDTVFTMDVVAHMLALLNDLPQIDALVSVQAKREENTMLFKPYSITDEEAKSGSVSINMKADTVRVAWGHFGCTLIRKSILEKMPHPWFAETPDKNGNWGDGRVDNDIAFWNKLNEVGGQVHVALHCPIGHTQQMVTWPTKDMKITHQYVNDWLATKRPPANALE